MHRVEALLSVSWAGWLCKGRPARAYTLACDILAPGSMVCILNFLTNYGHGLCILAKRLGCCSQPRCAHKEILLHNAVLVMQGCWGKARHPKAHVLNSARSRLPISRPTHPQQI